MESIFITLSVSPPSKGENFKEWTLARRARDDRLRVMGKNKLRQESVYLFFGVLQNLRNIVSLNVESFGFDEADIINAV